MNFSHKSYADDVKCDINSVAELSTVIKAMKLLNINTTIFRLGVT